MLSEIAANNLGLSCRLGTLEQRIDKIVHVVSVEGRTSADVQIGARLVWMPLDTVDTPIVLHTLVVAAGHHLVACGVEEYERRLPLRRHPPVAIRQAVLLQGLLQRVELLGGESGRHGAHLEVFDHLRPEALVYGAVAECAVGVGLPVSLVLLHLTACICLITIGFGVPHLHRESASAADFLAAALYLGVLLQPGLYLVSGKFLILQPFKDACIDKIKDVANGCERKGNFKKHFFENNLSIVNIFHNITIKDTDSVSD